ncbi:MAG: CvpA family protein [Pseudomonadota bacterium]|nr:CvpA family protein [Pseudomonadota bacterium]
MNFLDIAVISLIALTGLTAFSMGFVRVCLALIGWVGAIFSTLYLFHYLQPIARKWISIQILADGTAGLIIFIGSLIIFTMISHLIGNQIRASVLSALDRTLGLIFGIGIGVVVVSLGYIVLVWTIDLPKEPAQQPKWVKEAKTKYLLRWGALQLQNLTPNHWVRVPNSPKETTKMLNQQFEKLVNPELQIPNVKNNKGYNKSQRREMDRLIQGQQ